MVLVLFSVMYIRDREKRGHMKGGMNTTMVS